MNSAPFRLNLGERLLLREGHRVRLRAKVFETLCVLAENAGWLLSKDTLMQAIWRNTIVEENNLDHNISVLRKALGEKAGGQQYIETVPRKGYRFVAEVREQFRGSAPAGVRRTEQQSESTGECVRVSEAHPL